MLWFLREEVVEIRDKPKFGIGAVIIPRSKVSGSEEGGEFYYIHVKTGRWGDIVH